MANKSPTISEIIEQLPRKLQLRFNSIGNYAQGLIDEEITQSQTAIKLTDDETQLIKLATFVYILDSFFRTGTNAARIAATTFENMGLSGFQVGSTIFTRNNADTRRGEVLARELRKSIARTKLGRTIQHASSVKDLVVTLIREISDGKSVG